jgi:hypothetical protein
VSALVGTSCGLVVSLKPVKTGSTTRRRFTSVMWPQRVLRYSSFQYKTVRGPDSGSGRPRKNERSKTPSPSELATMKLQTLRSSPSHCRSIDGGVLYHSP